ncbi:MAG: hypothetical protein LBD44_02180 [Spirochaetaceae bacterium]|jgi:hypothetical protein|nr:hypothetical protein [Spirochaetaceae bacterium]
MAKSQDDKDIFDRSFKQIMGSISSRAMVRFINGLFDSNHPLDSEVKRLNTEYIDKALKKRLCDETVSVGRTIYVIEEQTTDDANMAIRVFEYGYAQALHDKETQGRVIELKFPRMIVLYLEALASTPDVLTVRLRFPDSSEHDFNVKTVKLLEYSVEELLERGMAVLLPFYIVRLRKAARNARTEEERGKAETDFKNLALKLKEAIEGGTDENIFSEEDIATLLERLFRLVKYVGEGYKSTTGVRKMIKKSLMGYGQVLVLKGERKGIKEGKLESARNALKKGLSIEQVAEIVDIPTDELKKRL